MAKLDPEDEDLWWVWKSDEELKAAHNFKNSENESERDYQISKWIVLFFVIGFLCYSCVGVIP